MARSVQEPRRARLAGLVRMHAHVSDSRDAYVRLSGVGKSYGPLRVLENLELELHRSELVVVAGRRRSGKTTLIELIGATQRPTSGTIVVGGRRLDLLDDRGLLEFRTANVALAPQVPTLAPTLTAHETVLQGVRLSRARRPERWVRTLLEELALNDQAGVRAGELPAEAQQRLSLARALAKQAPLLLLDEPLAAVNAETRERLLAAARRLSRSEMTVVLTTRETEAPPHADRVVRL